MQRIAYTFPSAAQQSRGPHTHPPNCSLAMHRIAPTPQTASQPCKGLHAHKAAPMHRCHCSTSLAYWKHVRIALHIDGTRNAHSNVAATPHSRFALCMYSHFSSVALHSIFIFIKFFFLCALDSDRAQIWFVAPDSGLVDDCCCLFHFKSPLRPGSFCFLC